MRSSSARSSADFVFLGLLSMNSVASSARSCKRTPFSSMLSSTEWLRAQCAPWSHVLSLTHVLTVEVPPVFRDLFPYRTKRNLTRDSRAGTGAALQLAALALSFCIAVQFGTPAHAQMSEKQVKMPQPRESSSWPRSL